MRWLRIGVQIGVLAAIYRAATVIVEYLHLPVPGNVLGMLLLFGLLSSGAVEEAWVADGAGFLTRHFSLFFIPILVGLIDWAGLLVASGPRLLIALVGSSLVGLVVTGRVVQRLTRPQTRAAAGPRRAEAKP